MSIKGFPKRLKTGNKQTQFSLDRSMPFQNCGQGCQKAIQESRSVKREIVL